MGITNKDAVFTADTFSGTPIVYDESVFTPEQLKEFQSKLNNSGGAIALNLLSSSGTVTINWDGGALQYNWGLDGVTE